MEHIFPHTASRTKCVSFGAICCSGERCQDCVWQRAAAHAQLFQRCKPPSCLVAIVFRERGRGGRFTALRPQRVRRASPMLASPSSVMRHTLSSSLCVPSFPLSAQSQCLTRPPCHRVCVIPHHRSPSSLHAPATHRLRLLSFALFLGALSQASLLAAGTSTVSVSLCLAHIVVCAPCRLTFTDRLSASPSHPWRTPLRPFPPPPPPSPRQHRDQLGHSHRRSQTEAPTNHKRSRRIQQELCRSACL